MLFFRSEEHVDRWCKMHGVEKRPVLTLDQLWQLAVTWYENRMTVDSRRPAPAEMVRIFANIGLEGPFWDPSADQFTT
jgi:hypothetical protein